MVPLIKKSIEVLRIEGAQDSVLQVWEVILALSLCFLCALVLSYVYRTASRNAENPRSFQKALVLTSLVTTVVMIVIGSNVARAFALVGAFSLVRFRNAVKETFDVAFLFFGMAVAMAVGTRYYAVAVIATGLISTATILLFALNFGSKRVDSNRNLRIRLPSGVDPESALRPQLTQLFRS